MDADQLRAAAELLSQYMDPNWSEEDARTILCLLIERNVMNL